jgi:hypothetical protein
LSGISGGSARGLQPLAAFLKLVFLPAASAYLADTRTMHSAGGAEQGPLARICPHVEEDLPDRHTAAFAGSGGSSGPVLPGTRHLTLLGLERYAPALLGIEFSAATLLFDSRPSHSHDLVGTFGDYDVVFGFHWNLLMYLAGIKAPTIHIIAYQRHEVKLLFLFLVRKRGRD